MSALTVDTREIMGDAALVRGVRDRLGSRAIVLVGIMGAGKSSVGKRLARRIDVPFMDADVEIEAAAHMTIPEIFARHGEPFFRDKEKRVIARLLDGGPLVLATGGGAYMNEETRAAVAARGVSVWLKADLDVVMRRVRRRDDRPMLHGDDPTARMRHLIEVREPFYAESAISIQSRDVPHEVIVEEVLAAVADHLGVVPSNSIF